MVAQFFAKNLTFCIRRFFNEWLIFGKLYGDHKLKASIIVTMVTRENRHM